MSSFAETDIECQACNAGFDAGVRAIRAGVDKPNLAPHKQEITSGGHAVDICEGLGSSYELGFKRGWCFELGRTK